MNDNERRIEDLDEEFERIAKEALAEDAARQERRGSGGSFSFEKIKWSGLVPKKMKIYRFLGGIPALGIIQNEKIDNCYSARTVRISKVIDDRGKIMRIVFPRLSQETARDYFLWRVIDRVNEVIYAPNKDGEKNEKGEVKKEKVYINKHKYPDVFNIVNFSNLPESDPKRKFGLLGRGWAGKEVLLANVLDREMMDWHRENKHSCLLTKDYRTWKNADGTIGESAEDGVPANGLATSLYALMQTYKYWGKYDIGIERTGLKNPAYRVINASRTPEVASPDVQHLISSELTTPEELSWKMYDLNKLYSPVTYTKLWNRLHLTIQSIDAKLGTHFTEELKSLVDQEAKEKAELKEAETTSVVVEQNEGYSPEEFSNEEFVPSEQDEEEPSFEEPLQEKVTERVITSPIHKTDISPKLLLGYSGLTEIEKAGISKVVGVGTETTPSIITYTKNYTQLAACPTCKTKAPSEYTSCPGCGATFKESYVF